jgi:hypothetical protein
MKDNPLIIGAVGEVGVMTANIIPQAEIEILLQIIIGIVTLVKLLKKPKKNEQ